MPWIIKLSFFDSQVWKVLKGTCTGHNAGVFVASEYLASLDQDLVSASLTRFFCRFVDDGLAVLEASDVSA
eukprot:3402980-Alexandrium_andersonii.AAC.1